MTNSRKRGYVQDVLYAGYAGAITGDGKWRKWRVNVMPTPNPAQLLKAISFHLCPVY